MNLLGAGVAQHLDELHHSGATHDGVVDHDEALALDVVAQRVKLHAHAHGAQLLRRLDKRTAHIAVLDEALAKGNTALVRIPLRGRQAGVGHADDQVGLDGLLMCQLTTHVVTAGVNALAVHDGVGTGEVDLLKDAVGGLFGCRHALLGYQTLGADAQDLAGTDVTDVLGAHDVECAGLGSNDPAAGARDMDGGVDRRGAVLRGQLRNGCGIGLVQTLVHQLAQHERANAVRIAECVERLLVDERHGVAAAHELHGLANALTQMTRTLGKVADKLGRDLGIRIGEERHAQLDQLAAQLVGVDQSAVVSKRDNDAVDGRKMRLRGFPALGTGSAIAHVAHGQLAGERRQVGVGEHAVEQAQVLANHNRAAVTHGDSRRFLAAVLQCTQAKVRQSSHVAIGRPHTKNAAFLMQLVGVRIIRRHGLHLSRGTLGRADGFLRHGIPSEPRYLALPALLYARQDKHSRA